MRSFIPWIGGKSALSKTITDIFPDNVGRYIEVFGGGGSILLHRITTQHWKCITMQTAILCVCSAALSITPMSFQRKYSTI